MNEPEKETQNIIKMIQQLHPRNWSMKYKIQALYLISALLALTIIVIVIFFAQKRSYIRMAQTHMSLYVDSKASHLEDYFKSINNHITEIASNSKTIEALNAFSGAFSGIEADYYFTENVSGIDDVSTLLQGFYTAEILPVLETKMNESLQAERFLPGDNRQKILQCLYLAENPRPLSQKYMMNRASDGSQYSRYHNEYHPQMLSFSRQSGINDLLLVDYKTGYVVYSLKKNIDFSTNLYEGPFKNSAVADAYLDAVGVSAPGMVKYTDASFYIPSLMQPVVFVSTPVFSGDQLLGAVIFVLDISAFDRLLLAEADHNMTTVADIKAFLIGDDFSYRSNDPDFTGDQDAYISKLIKHGTTSNESEVAARLGTTALIQKVNYDVFQDALNKGEGQVQYKTTTGEKAYCIFKSLENNTLNWIVCGQISRSDLLGPVYRILWLMVGAAVIMLLLIYFSGRYINNAIYRPLIKLKTALLDLKDGKTRQGIEINAQNEVGQTSEAFNMLSKRINEMSLYISELGRDNFDVKLEAANDDDQLCRALENLKENLVQKQSDELKRKNEDEIRNWSTHGIALFNDILRLDNDNLEKLSLNIMRNLIDYLKANQGGLFLLEEEEKEQKLNLITAIAFDRQKFMKKTIKVGEGLAGNCVLEKKTTVLNKVPDDYMEITSGLGGARPNSLIIVPLKKDEVVYGVIELASFNPFKQHEVEFIEKVAENITDTIVNVRLNLQNIQLVERFRQQEEEMKAQDEELRQNIEELQSTHEQMERMKIEEKEKTDKFIKEIEDNRRLLIDVLDNIPGKIFVKDENGVLLLLNSEVARVYNKKVDELIGTSDFDNHPYEEAKGYREKELEVLAKGGETYIQEEKLTGDLRYLKTTKMPFKIATTGKTGLMGIQIDVTEFVRMEHENKEKEEELRQNIEELKSTQEQMEHMKIEEKEKTDKFIKEIEDNRKLLIDVLDNIPGKIFVKDENGVLLLLNSEVARVYHKKVDELIGTSDFDNHPYEEAKGYREKELEVLAKGGETYIQEEKLTGDLRYLKTTKMPFKIATTGKTGLMGIQIDVTEFVRMEQENKEKEEELRQNIEELQSTQEQMERMKIEEKEKTDKFIKEIEDNRKLLIDVLDNIPGKIFVKDENGVLLLLNSEVARVYNKKVDELIGTSDFDNHPYEEAKGYREKELEILAKGGETYIQEEKLTGELRYLKTTKMPFKIATTGKKGLMGIQIDVTEFVRMEQENKEKEEELRQNIEELQSTQEQMGQFKKQEIEQKEQMLKKIEENRKLLIDVLDKIPGKIFVKDHNGVLLLLNSEVARVYNKKVEELIGTSDFDNHPHDLAVEYRAKEVEIMNKGAETYIQEETLTGEMRYLKTTKMPFKIAITGETGILGFQIDITETKTMEDKISQLKEELGKVRKKLKENEKRK